MGFGYPLAASTRYEMLGRSGGMGALVTASATANTKGPWTLIGTTSFEYDGIYIGCSGKTGSEALAAYRLDIGVGTTNQVVAADLFMDGRPGSSTAHLGIAPAFMPIRIAKGESVYARIQSTTASSTLALTVSGLQGAATMIAGARALLSATDWTSTDPSNSITLLGTTLSAWTQVTASTAARFSALYVGLSTMGGTPAWHEFILDVGKGMTGSEVAIFSLQSTHYYGSTATALTAWPAGPFPVDIPAGTRLVARAQSAYGSASGANGLMLWGVTA